MLTASNEADYGQSHYFCISVSTPTRYIPPSITTLTCCQCVCVLFADVLEYYLQNQILNSPSQFIEQYIKPTHVTLDSGRHHIIIEIQVLIKFLTPYRVGVACSNKTVSI